MDRRTFLRGLSTGLLAAPVAAQRATNSIARIGILSIRKPNTQSALNDALFDGLRDHGYVVGRNLLIEFPDAQEREDLLHEAAAKLVSSKVDLILVIGPAPMEAARQATKTIPLVMVASSADPVAEGFAQSLARPGGNITGLTYAEPDRFKKQLELLKAVAPRTDRVVLLWDFDVQTYRRFWQAPLADAGRILKIAVEEPVRVRSPADLPGAFAAIEQRANALVVASGGTNFNARDEIARLALLHRLPAIAAFKEFPQAGLLMSYGPDLPDINRRAAGYVDRILKGAQASDLPIELPNKFELFINGKTVAALDLTIPPSVKARADQVL
ncbi:MAG TPA: ABC transporter substrate-binding protein [Casimicrobiaceae bacterium]|nr:ABC transporter substrate-binding protein [Casimicrobiaceae bacterium]